MKCHKLTITGHCYSLKTSQEIHRRGGRMVNTIKDGKLARKMKGGRPSIGKRKNLKKYMETAILELKARWSPRETIKTQALIEMVVFFAGPEPDSWGPAETVSDLLEAAGVIENDRLLTPAGSPAIKRIRVPKCDERVELKLFVDGIETGG